MPTTLRARIESLPALRDVIAQHGLSAEKSLGQNFLLDLNLTDKIVKLAGPVEGLHVIEIGPGPGGLTRALLKAGANVTAVDLDVRVPTVLEHLVQASAEKLHIVLADALQTNVLNFGKNGQRAIVANLPYNVATPLLIGWLKQIHADPKNALQFMHLMFQKEVAERVVALANSSAYGRLSVMCQWLCETHIACVLPPSAFTPPPKVHSAVVHFKPRQHAPEVSFEAMEQVVAKAFGQRRKMMRAIFKGQEALLEQAGIAPTARAETLQVADFVKLTQLLN